MGSHNASFAAFTRVSAARSAVSAECKRPRRQTSSTSTSGIPGNGQSLLADARISSAHAFAMLRHRVKSSGRHSPAVMRPNGLFLSSPSGHDAPPINPNKSLAALCRKPSPEDKTHFSTTRMMVSLSSPASVSWAFEMLRSPAKKCDALLRKGFPLIRRACLIALSSVLSAPAARLAAPTLLARDGFSSGRRDNSRSQDSRFHAERYALSIGRQLSVSRIRPSMASSELSLAA